MQIADLKSLGPKSQEMLNAAGIHSVEQIHQLGSVQVYFQVKRLQPTASLNLLWALESAITGMPWQEVARLHRTSLLLALNELEQIAANAPK